MAFNWQTFRTRTLTAAIFVVVMLAGLLWNQWSFFILFSIIHFGCWWEYQKLVGLIDPGYAKISAVHKYSIMIAGWCIMLYFTNDSYKIFDQPLWKTGEWGGIIFFVIAIVSAITKAKNIAHSIFGLIYISLSWGLMMNLYSKDFFYDAISKHYDYNGYWIYLWIIAIIWINDTMAYIVGSLIGKTPLSKISPKKTWEGTVGGIILSVIVAGAVAYLSDRFKPIAMEIAIIAAIAAIAGTFGDLFESKLKRLANVKDSGSIMPGHGGFLDRFDSMLLAIPAVWLYVYFFLR